MREVDFAKQKTEGETLSPSQQSCQPPRQRGPILLAAAAVVVAAAVVAAVVAAPGAAAIAQQEDQNDDPANVTAAETVIVTHKTYLRKMMEQELPLIPRYSCGEIWCGSDPCFLVCQILLLALLLSICYNT